MMNRLQAWWTTQTDPGDVDQEWAWRGQVLNNLLLSMVILAAIYALVTFIQWTLGLDQGSFAVAVATGLIGFALLKFSRRKNIATATLLFSLALTLLSFLLTLGWGVGDITGSAIYAATILEISLLLRGKSYAYVLSALLLGYLIIGWLEFSGLFVPPFYTTLEANHINVAIILVVFVFWGYIAGRLIDRTMAAQIAEAKRLQELESRTRIAAEVQVSMLPTQPPKNRYYQVAGQSIPAREVGGDFYSYHTLPGGGLAVVIGDVSGKGMPAALLMAVTTGIIGGLITSAPAPSGLLRDVAYQLRKHTKRNGLNTACQIIYLKEHKLCVANAGGIEPVIYSADGELTWVPIGGPPLGTSLIPDSYEEKEIMLSVGDMLVFVTDGVVEAVNSVGKMLGFGRLEEIIVNGPTDSAEAMKAHILQQVQLYQGEAEQADDITVVIVQVKENDTDVS